MLIESDQHQVRIAVLENERLTEIFVERKGRGGLVGNIYKGRVTRVLPGMQAAFVDIGLERDAFLYVSDVSEVVDLERELEEAEPVPEDRAADPETARLRVGGHSAVETERAIDQLLQVDQELLVQVTKDALLNKGARVSAHVTLPSRYLVLLPTMRHLGLSRRITDEVERERLRAALQELGEEQFGLIVRTAGEGQHPDDFRADHLYLTETWGRIADAAKSARAPSLVHAELSLALRVVRDLFSEHFGALWVDTPEAFERVVEFLDQVQPALAAKVKLDTSDTSLFDRFGVEREIEAALQSKVWLKSGGYLVINQTEALVAIDVNTGRYVGQSSLEDTVLRTNLEAVQEIVRQIRLRDLSGILIVDLIDMTEQEHRDRVFHDFEEELKKDRAKSKVLQISEFGLIEITRKRSHTNLERLLTRRCPYCEGRGRIKTLATICLNLRAEVLRHLRRRSGSNTSLLLRVHPEVAAALEGPERAILDELVSAAGGDILLRQDAELHHERFDLSEL
ncbi:MAG TPA: Rne/Rng family ribonuclease [Thermoanaerobaculia bacterium]|nr:Rne/Rng family ribonuclease [Thermoanaerobaculia bacterium]